MSKTINFVVLSYCPIQEKLVTVSRHRILSRAQKAATRAEQRYGHSTIQEWTAEDREFINRYFSQQGNLPLQSL